MTDDPNGLPAEIELPLVYSSSDAASTGAQREYLALSGIRLWALIAAALSGALGFVSLDFDILGLTMLIAFVAAAASEFALLARQPERTWYSGRAVAESAKTLVWRFAVRGEPFGPDLNATEAEDLLRLRLDEVLKKGKDRMTIGLGDVVASPSMRKLRDESFETRRARYLAERTGSQRKWYADKAKWNETRATRWRYGLLIGEIVAVVAAAIAFGKTWQFDFAGIIAALAAGGAAWLSLKQHSQLTSAYRVAAAELGIQHSVLESIPESDWSQAVADAEEAISREHTMWLASRGEEPI